MFYWDWLYVVLYILFYFVLTEELPLQMFIHWGYALN